jgi:hypothetical protein
VEGLVNGFNFDVGGTLQSSSVNGESDAEVINSKAHLGAYRVAPRDLDWLSSGMEDGVSNAYRSV